MSDLFTVDFTGVSALKGVLEAKAAQWHYEILIEYVKAADVTYTESQIDVPVGETGDLKESGRVCNLIDNGPGGSFSIDVTYGDGNTSATYDYPQGAATTDNAVGDMEADGYAWFVELGHMSTAGNPVPPANYLGSNFDIQVLALQSRLLGML